MADPATEFASNFDSIFRSLTHGLPHKEIPLFQAMHSALANLSGKFHIEEYHGTSHQVTFTGNGTYARTHARCELSDLMIVTYSPISRHVRLTFLQAKSERATLPSACGRAFSANLEQWFLLSTRPHIIGAGTFNPPSDLLSNAFLPSVGSFAFFFKNLIGDFQTYYAAASYMVPPASYSQRYGKLQAIGPCIVVNKAGHAECLAACGNSSFAKSLYNLEIGTPIHSTIPQSLPTRNWLSANLRFQILKAEQGERPSSLAQELLDLLEPEDKKSSSSSFGATKLIIIKSSAEPNPSFNRDAPKQVC
ncbi:hypothetical protein HNP49_002209 [Pseudomonas fluvialis]|uniref:Uncharacterized protein n=1 Tax=Pseudomonas fluvialis TaxID=1793966 RepID=A0A7X0BV46_9PSED|nr:hypothetical protein [Pseudomonas fluvialis]MBB6342041.1 hypothetical protein [Pseudomonas fluvialis]